MTGLVRKATLFAVCGLLAASAAMASVPSPANSTCPPCVSLVGSSGGVIDPAGEFCVTVHDLANVPINNSLVVVDFSACSGVTLCDNNEAGFTVDCLTQTVRGFTGPGGVICFRIKGHGNTVCDDAPRNAYNCAKIYADGVLLCSPSVNIYDLNGGGAVGASDLSAWLCDFFGPNNPSRSDYDCSGAVGASDLSAWLSVFFGGGSSENCPAGGKGECTMVP